MSNLSTFLNQTVDTPNFRTLFTEKLHKAPFHLKYSTDKNRPDLFLIHPTEKSDPENELVRECNGIIVEDSTRRIVCYGTQGLVNKKCVDFIDDASSIIQTHDGTMVKVFYYNEKKEWIVSTNRRIDASRVKWSSTKSFYELLLLYFNNIEDLQLEVLDKANTYSFILLSPENQHVILYPTTDLIFVSSRNNTTFEVSYEKPASFPCSTQVQIDKEQFLINIQNQTRQEFRGVIVDQKYKIDYPWFVTADSLRKNLPSLRLSYLACNTTEKEQFKRVFGNEAYYKSLDVMFNNIAIYILNIYRESYIRRLYLVPKDHPVSYVTNRIHSLYKMTGIPTDFGQVVKVLDDTPCHIIDSIISSISTRVSK